MAVAPRCIDVVADDSYVTMPELTSLPMERGRPVGAYLIHGLLELLPQSFATSAFGRGVEATR
jgi:hypothetical protein